MSEQIGVIGSGQVGKTLAEGFANHGYDVIIGTREPGKLAAWHAEATGRLGTKSKALRVGTFGDAGGHGRIVVLAVKGSIAEQAIRLASADGLAGKIVIDATNPIAEAAPEQGVLKFFTNLDHSLMETLQAKFAEARFVKAFSSVGAGLMVNPKLPGGRPSMFIAGNDAAAKARVTQLLDQLGWNTEDMGTAVAARAIEPLCILWCLPGFLRNDWMHAFAVLRP